MPLSGTGRLLQGFLAGEVLQPSDGICHPSLKGQCISFYCKCIAVWALALQRQCWTVLLVLSRFGNNWFVLVVGSAEIFSGQR